MSKYVLFIIVFIIGCSSTMEYKNKPISFEYEEEVIKGSEDIPEPKKKFILSTINKAKTEIDELHQNNTSLIEENKDLIQQNKKLDSQASKYRFLRNLVIGTFIVIVLLIAARFYFKFF